jgi:hypothetical protein
MINTRTSDDGRHVSLHQLISNRFSQHRSERRVDDPHRIRRQTSLGTLSQETTHPSRRQRSQPNRTETRPDMHPHGVRVVRPRGRPKPCTRHGLQPVSGVRAHRPRLPRQRDPNRRLGQQNRQLLAGLGTRPPVHLSTDSAAVRAKHIRGSRPSPILAKIDRTLSVRAAAQDRSQESVS